MVSKLVVLGFVIAFAAVLVQSQSSSSSSQQGSAEIGYLGNLFAYVLTTVFGVTSSGVGVYVPGFNGTVDLGSDALPSNLDCEIEPTKQVACYVCYSDCLVVHNRFGGTCTSNPLAGSRSYADTVCFCDDTPNYTANGTGAIPTPYDYCGLLPSALTPVVNEAINEALIVRELAALCQINPLTGEYISTGCSSDCITNHQYDQGVCEQAIPVSTYPGQYTSSSPTQLFCICSYNSTATPTNTPKTVSVLGTVLG